jgi:hypothetical protein
MSQTAVVVPFEADPALVLIRAEGPILYVGAPVAPGWASWAGRLDARLAASCRELRARGRRARRVTVTLTYEDGRRRRRSMTLPRATDDAREVLPAALGLLRLLVAERPGVASKLSVHFAQISRPDGRALKGRALKFGRRPAQTAKKPAGVGHAWLRAMAAVGLLVGMPLMLPLH